MIVIPSEARNLLLARREGREQARSACDII